jgi:uncharacterized membrane protein
MAALGATMKLVFHLIVFLAGAGVGIWWGVNHPSQAQTVSSTEVQEAARIQATVSQEKIALLQRFLGTSDPNQAKSDFKQMLSDEQQKLESAKSELGNKAD